LLLCSIAWIVGALTQGIHMSSAHALRSAARALARRQLGNPPFLRKHLPLVLGTTVALAASALFVRAKTRAAERENPPEGQFITVQGLRLHYVERGQGQPLVLLHGNGSMVRDFATSGLLERAARSYRVIVFDRPGYGHSERPRRRVWTAAAQAELIYDALRELGIEHPIVLGHSWGVFVALRLALAHPEYVRSLILLSGYYYPTPRMDVPLLSPPAIPIIGDLMRYTVSPLFGRLIWPLMLRRIFSPTPVPEHFRDFPVWMGLRPSQLRASAEETALMIPTAFALAAHYRELQMPVMIMDGADDRHLDAHLHSAGLHRELPQSELRLVPGAGHMIHHSAPDEVIAAIRAIDAKQPAGRAARGSPSYAT
jgi:pimeloyl-ACP methyl ester carboxylesterase